jgi:4-hydroxy-2-oxoheptanedioate aldolase
MIESVAELGRSDVSILVRVRSLEAGLIGRALDAGANGVIVPMVSTAEQARAAVSASHYPPLGQRSWGPIFDTYEAGTTPSDRNAAVMCAVMIETPAGLDNALDIAATPGIDMVFVGPFDLALALGVNVDVLLSDTTETGPLQRIVQACTTAGIIAGAFGGTPERAARLRRHGFTYLAAATDALVITRGARSLRDNIDTPESKS